MRVGVTGGSGKIGVYVVEELLYAGHEVTVIDLVPPPAALGGVSWKKANIEDFGQVVAVFHEVEAVIHLAAIPRPGTVPDHVLFRTNLLGTYHVHEAAYRCGIKRVVSTSSAAVLGWTYGDHPILPQYLPVDEKHPVFPHDPYGLSKLCGEEVARSYALKTEMETVVLRVSWVIFPEAAAKLRAEGGTKPEKLNLGAYVDVRDLAHAYRQALERPGLCNEVLYICADDSTTVEPLCGLLPRLAPAVRDMASSLTDHRPGISNERAKRVLQWRPRHSWRSEKT